MYILSPYDGGKSFGGKAKVITAARGEKVLRSSETIVCCVDKRGNFSRLWKGADGVTLRHINSFRIAYQLAPITKSEWKEMPVRKSGFLSL